MTIQNHQTEKNIGTEAATMIETMTTLRNPIKMHQPSRRSRPVEIAKVNVKIRIPLEVENEREVAAVEGNIGKVKDARRMTTMMNLVTMIIHRQ